MEARAIRDASTASDQILIDQHYELRARVFAGRLGWNVQVREGKEKDEYDGIRPTYILALTETNALAGCARLLPATGPTMLERTFPQLLAAGSLSSHSAMVESSRFCVDTSLEEGREGGQLHRATLTMFAAIIEWSMTNGFSEIVTATDLRFERILNRAGWPMQRLGAPCTIGNTRAIAGSLPADEASFRRVCPPDYRSSLGALSAASLRSAA